MTTQTKIVDDGKLTERRMIHVWIGVHPPELGDKALCGATKKTHANENYTVEDLDCVVCAQLIKRIGL